MNGTWCLLLAYGKFQQGAVITPAHLLNVILLPCLVSCLTNYIFLPLFFSSSHFCSQSPCLSRTWTSPWLCPRNKLPACWPTPSSVHSPGATRASLSTTTTLRLISTGNSPFLIITQGITALGSSSILEGTDIDLRKWLSLLAHFVVSHHRVLHLQFTLIYNLITTPECSILLWLN